MIEERIKNNFFNSYKYFIDYISLSYKEYSIYKIIVAKRKISDTLTKVNITIENTKYEKHERRKYEDIANNNYFSFISSITLNNEQAVNLIKQIRNDFRDNHFVIYSYVNPNTLVQILQNTKFSLCIKLDTEEELEEAKIFDDKINRDKNRYTRAKVLTSK